MLSSKIKSTRVSDRIVVDGYTGSWQPALCPRRMPTIGDVVALAEDADAREFDDFRGALSAAGLSLHMSTTRDKSGRNVGVVAAGNKDGEQIVW